MKMDEITVKKLEEAFAIDASIPESCYYANISKQTYYNWIEKYPELKTKFDRLRQRPVLKARQTIANDLYKIDTAKWYLEKKRKNEFGKDINMNISGELTMNKLLSELNGNETTTED